MLYYFYDLLFFSPVSAAALVTVFINVKEKNNLRASLSGVNLLCCCLTLNHIWCTATWPWVCCRVVPSPDGCLESLLMSIKCWSSDSLYAVFNQNSQDYITCKEWPLSYTRSQIYCVGQWWLSVNGSGVSNPCRYLWKTWTLKEKEIKNNQQRTLWMFLIDSQAFFYCVPHLRVGFV